MYKNELKELAKRNNVLDELVKIKNHFDDMSGYVVHKTALSNELLNCHDVKVLFGYNTFRYIQQLLFRSKVIAEGSISLINNDQSLSSIILVRSHYETTGCIAFLYKRLESYYNGNINFERINEDLFRLSLGATTIDHEVVPKPFNVMKMIDSVDYLVNRDIYKYPNDKEPLFRGNYEVLSDYCHPNFHGIKLGSYFVPEEKSFVFLNKDKVTEETLSYHLDIELSLDLFLIFYRKSLSLIKNNEHMPLFHDLH